MIKFIKLGFIFYAIAFVLIAIAVLAQNTLFGLMGILVTIIGFCVDLFMKYKKINEEITEIKIRIKDGEKNEIPKQETGIPPN